MPTLKHTKPPLASAFASRPDRQRFKAELQTKLPLCCELAAQPGRYLFANWQESMLMDQPADARQDDAIRLKGMLCAYMEMDTISADQGAAMTDELTAFAFGAIV